MRVPVALHSRRHVVFSFVLILATWEGVWWHLIVALIHIFLWLIMLFTFSHVYLPSNILFGEISLHIFPPSFFIGLSSYWVSRVIYDSEHKSFIIYIFCMYFPQSELNSIFLKSSFLMKWKLSTSSFMVFTFFGALWDLFVCFTFVFVFVFTFVNLFPNDFSYKLYNVSFYIMVCDPS